MATAMPPTPTTPGSPIDKPIPILKENEKYHCFIAYSFKEQDIGNTSLSIFSPCLFKMKKILVITCIVDASNDLT